MLEVLDRRITRRLSAELQARAQAQALFPNEGEQAQQIVSTASHPQGQEAFRLVGQMAGDVGTGNGEDSSRWGAVTLEQPQYLRNCSEEIFLRSFMDAQMPPTNEGMSFLGPPHPSRVNSEELFNSWLSTGDNTSGLPPLSVQHRHPPPSRKMSNELAGLLGQQYGTPFQIFDISKSMEYNSNYSFSSDGVTKESGHVKSRNCVANMGSQLEHPSSQLINWFNQSRPMTRSRSSELRRKYSATQDLHALPSTTATLQWLASQGAYDSKQAVASLGAFTRTLASARQNSAITSSHQITPIAHAPMKPPLREKGGSVSAVVSMLKGSIERKKLSAAQQQAHHVVGLPQLTCLKQEQEDSYNNFQDPQLHNFQSAESQQQLQYNQNVTASTSALISNEQFQSGMLAFHAQSPSDSSGAAPGLSAGAANSEDPCNSGPTVSIRNFNQPAHNTNFVDQSLLQNNTGNEPSPPSNGPSNGGALHEDALQTDFQKRQPHLTRAGSITSSCKSGVVMDLEGSSKKRRVERKRMMTEAKGRGCTPMLPSDLQTAIKRCETLEKEVRSLKLNLSFMNRKDSEQTKQIEDLEKKNEELLEEKDRLTDELSIFNSIKGSGRARSRSLQNA